MSAFSEELSKLAAAKGKMSIPQSRKGRRPMKVDTMLKKEKDGSLYKYTKMGSAWAKLAGAVGVEMVDGKKRILSDMEAQEKARQGMQIPSVILGDLESMFAGEPEGIAKAGGEIKAPVNPGLTSKSVKKPGDAPTVTDDMVFAGDEDAYWIQPNQVKQANFHSFFDEFLKLGAVTREEAAEALGRLKELEEEKPTIGELGRGSATGAIVGPGAMIAATAAKGGLSRKAVTGAVTKALRGAKPGRWGKAKAIGGLIGGALAAPAASGAVFGTGLPLVRRKMDVEAEKEQLRQYTGTSRRGRVHRQATQYLGV